MFGNNNNKKREVTRTSTPLPTGSNLNSLATGTRIEGTVHAENDIRVDGVISGKLFCSAKVIIGPSGKIDGEIQCQTAVIEGQFEGTLQVNDVLEIMEKAKVTGELMAGRLVVQPGAVINGSFDMNNGTKKLPAVNLNGNTGLPSAKTTTNSAESSRR